jgi:hypothetical protein
MVLSLDIVAIVFLVIILFQDFKFRKISWILLPFLLIVFALKSFLLLDAAEAGILCMKNFGFLLIQFLALFVFYLLKERKPVNLINSKIGLGDVLFFIAICPSMSLLNFLFYCLIGIIGTIAGYLLVRLFSPNASTEVPFAGSLSFTLMLFIFAHYLSNNFDLYNDGFITGLLTSWKP